MADEVWMSTIASFDDEGKLTWNGAAGQAFKSALINNSRRKNMIMVMTEDSTDPEKQFRAVTQLLVPSASHEDIEEAVRVVFRRRGVNEPLPPVDPGGKKPTPTGKQTNSLCPCRSSKA